MWLQSSTNGDKVGKPIGLNDALNRDKVVSESDQWEFARLSGQPTRIKICSKVYQNDKIRPTDGNKQGQAVRERSGHKQLQSGQRNMAPEINRPS